ncbi:MAG: methyltransferase domain-containing protein, partial [Candidatus Omnitrophica bacterium]|nr:methyltransferase domain-containing protein [Candidatus Omnitrophota bacterium]
MNKAAGRYRYLSDIIRKSDSVLDVGSGTGVFVYMLRGLGFNARGIEPNEGYAQYSVAELNAPVRIAFMQDLEPDLLFNIITVFHVLEHA